MRKKSLSEFIQQSHIVHNNKFNYNLVVLTNLRSKICVICPIHGEFIQTANEHLKGYGCALCGGTKRKNLNDFIIQAKKIHHNKYNYSKVNYKNSLTVINIICPIHGEFLQLPKTHLKGAGCHKCNGGIISNIFEFISKANIKHQNMYDYSKSEYKSSKIKLEIVCKKHKSFWQTPNDHLNGAGCPKCTRLGRTSKIENEWLNSLNIPIEYRNFQIKINNKFYYVDGFSPITNTVYEFYGDFWHGNPKIYLPNDINHINKKTYKELYDATLIRQNIIKQAGYNIISVWEYDFKELDV